MAKRVLEVQIIGDATSLKRAMGTAGAETERFGKRTEGVHARIRGHFAGITQSAVKAGAGAVAAYAGIEGAKKAVDATETLAKTTLVLSKNFGLTTKQASEWAAVAQSRDIDGNKLTLGFKGLSTAIRGAESGSKAQVAAFRELGISQETLSKHGNDLNFMLKAVSDGLAKLPPGTERSALQAKLFGRTWQTLSPLLRDGGAAMQEQLNAAEKFGATLSGSTTKELQEHIKAQREAKLATLGLQVAFGTQLAPALTSVIEKVTASIGFFREHHDAAAVLKPVIIGLAGALAIAKVAQIGLNLATLSNPYVAVAAAVAALTVATVAAYHSSATFRSVVDGAYHGIQSAVGTSTAAVRAFLAGHRADIRATEQAVHDIGAAVRFVWDHVVLPVVQRVLPAVVQVVRGAFNVIRGLVEVLTGVLTGDFGRAWDGVRHIFSGGVSGAVGIVRAATAPMRAAVDAVTGAAESAAESGWTAIKHGVSAFAGDMRALVVGAFKGAANDVVTFINDIIDVINVIPGVPNIGHVKGFAQGGVIEAHRTGGLVTAPTVIMGEEAPRHPEFVIPTNPAYRGRAQMLVGQAAQAVGLATGGTFRGKVSTFGPPMEAAGTTASGVSSAEPGIALYNRGTLGKMFEVSIAGHSANLKQTDIGPAPWTGRIIDVTGAGARAMGFDPRNFPTDSIGTASTDGDSGGGGIIGKIFGAVGGIIGDLLEKGAGFLLDKLPDVSGLPDWLKGTGGYVLDKAKDWIIAKVKDVIASFGGDKVGRMIAFAEGVDAQHFPYVFGGGHGSFSGPYDCSGFVSAILHAGGMLDSPITTDGLKVYGEAGDGELITIGVRGTTGANAHTMIKIGNRYYESGGGHGAARVDGWDGDFPIHRHPPGMASGGIIGRVGELGPEDVYANGIGQVRVRPASQSGRGGGDVMLTKHGNVNINSRRDVDLALRKLSLRIA